VRGVLHLVIKSCARRPPPRHAYSIASGDNARFGVSNIQVCNVTYQNIQVLMLAIIARGNIIALTRRDASHSF